MISIFKKYMYKKELKTIILKLNYLLKEAQENKATETDIPFWTIYLERLEEINNSNLIKDTQSKRDFYFNAYNKYIKQFENKEI